MSPRELTPLDRNILNAIQKDFPMESRPWATIAKRLDPLGQLTEEEVLMRVKSLRQDGFIRRLGAIFNSAPLGYYSTLCAATVPPEHLDIFTALVNAAPQITHNYLRPGKLNVWFTFTTNQDHELPEFLTKLKQEGGSTAIHEFKAGKKFKINSTFHLTETKKT